MMGGDATKGLIDTGMCRALTAENLPKEKIYCAELIACAPYYFSQWQENTTKKSALLVHYSRELIDVSLPKKESFHAVNSIKK